MTMLVEITYLCFQIKQEKNRTVRNREGLRTKEEGRKGGIGYLYEILLGLHFGHFSVYESEKYICSYGLYRT